MADKALAADAMVAEKVFGWRRLEGPEVPDEHMDLPDDGWPIVWVDANGRLMACKTCGNLPAFSTDIADAWLVVQKMLADTDRAIDFSLAYLGLLREREPFLDQVNNEETWVYKVLKHLDPYTICLAALGAVGALGDIDKEGSPNA